VIKAATGAEQALEDDGGVADVRGGGNIFAFDAATLIRGVGPPAAALSPAAVGVRGFRKLGETVVGDRTEGLGRDGIRFRGRGFLGGLRRAVLHGGRNGEWGTGIDGSAVAMRRPRSRTVRFG
jgi:hypothetical protein